MRLQGNLQFLESRTRSAREIGKSGGGTLYIFNSVIYLSIIEKYLFKIRSVTGVTNFTLILHN
jgi:hypothetical protein